ncbi:arginine/serine-rich protein 1 isoform X2 [Sebastes umbrosus]|nr:arginine/serine-rich protein 1 isoform X2 [Sebastes umbrosus]XP_037602502.1 arginine/serine-rich protein 1 isoform X2 [Sebastes umbrosus]
MTKAENSHSEMAGVRPSDGINVIFDQDSPASSRSPSRGSRGSKPSVGSVRHRGRGSHKGRKRSSSSSRSRSSSPTRSRSHPRCHRPSSRCRCDNHRRYGRGRQSPPRRHRSRSRSSDRVSRHRRAVSRYSQSPPTTHGSGSKSGSSGQSVNLSLDDKRELLKAAEANATRILGVEKLELPEGVKPILSEQSVESEQVSPDTWVRQDPEETLSQSSDEESDDDLSSPKMSPKRKTISFSINNSVLKPILAAPSSVKVTSRMDSYESRKPYGHWIAVKSGRTSKARKHTLASSH